MLLYFNDIKSRLFKQGSRLLLCMLFLLLLSHLFYVESRMAYIYYDEIWMSRWLSCFYIIAILLLFFKPATILVYTFFDGFAVGLFLIILLRSGMWSAASIELAQLKNYFLIILLPFFINNLIRNELLGQKAMLVTLIVISTCTVFFSLYMYSDSAANSVVGNFRNPNLLSAYLSLLFPVNLFYLLKKKSSVTTISIGLLSGINSVLIIGIVLLNNSRNALAAIVITMLCFLFIYLLRKGIRFLRLKNAIIGIGALLVLFTASNYLYHSKKASADGRWVIHKITLQGIMDAPIMGHGFNSFKKLYPLYQEAYLKQKIVSAELDLIDNTTHAFNEYLQLAFELGLLVLGGFLGLIFYFLRSILKDSTGPYQSLLLSLVLALLFSSFFYNMFHAYELTLMALIQLSVFIPFKSRPFRQPFMGKPAIAFLLLLLLVFQWQFAEKRAKAQFYWWKANEEINPGMVMMQYMQRAANALSNNPDYLYNLGAMEYKMNRWKESLESLSRAEANSSHTNLFLYKGNVYRALQKNDSALLYYQKASGILPHLFIPKNKIMMLQLRMGDTVVAKQLAAKIKSMKIKIPSQSVTQIKRNADKILSY